MIQKTSQAITFEAFFTAAKQGKPGLTVTVDVYSPVGSLIVTSGAATEIGGGFYRYTLAGTSTTSGGAYRAIFKTSDSSVDLQHIPSLWEVGVAGVDYLDGSVGAVQIATSDIADLSGQIATNTATLGSRLTAARATKLDNLDTTISSRLAASGYTAPANALLTELIGESNTTVVNIEQVLFQRLSEARAQKLDNLDRLDIPLSDLPSSAATAVWFANPGMIEDSEGTFGGRLITTAASVATNLDVTVSSRLAAADYEPEQGGGSGGTSSVRLIQGPLHLYSDAAGSDGVVEATTGDAITLALYLRDGNNEPIPYTDDSLTARLTDTFGNVIISSVPLTEISPAHGIAQAQFYFSQRGRFRLTIRRDGGPSDIITFGPLQIHVCGEPVGSPP